MGVLIPKIVSTFYTVAIEDLLQIEMRLASLICQILSEKAYVELIMGRDGEFDQLVFSTIRRSKREYQSDNRVLVCILPHPTADFRDNTYASVDMTGVQYTIDKDSIQS